MNIEQVTLRQLLSDDIYREWIRTPPIGGFPKSTKFRIYAQVKQDGPWAKRDFDTFKAAYLFLHKHLREWYDAALVSRTYPCRPPVVRVNGKRQYYAPMLNMVGHTWCPHCRRPTVFGHYTKHHAFHTANIDPLPFKRRCGICGIAETAIKHYKVQEKIR